MSGLSILPYPDAKTQYSAGARIAEPSVVDDVAVDLSLVSEETGAVSAFPLPQPAPPAWADGWERPPGARPIWPVTGYGLLLVLLVLLVCGALMLLALSGLAGLLTGLSQENASPTPAPILLVVPAQDGNVPPMPDYAKLDALAAQSLPPHSAETSPAPPEAEEPSPAPERPQERPVTYRELFQEVGAEFGLDWRLLAALAYRESRLDPAAVGADGDMGLMQILPSTWSEFAPLMGASDPYAPLSNARVAAAYLVYLDGYLAALDKNQLHWILVAYNWGPINVVRLHRQGGGWQDVPAIQQQYVADILEAAYGSFEPPLP